MISHKLTSSNSCSIHGHNYIFNLINHSHTARVYFGIPQYFLLSPPLAVTITKGDGEVCDVNNNRNKTQEVFE